MMDKRKLTLELQGLKEVRERIEKLVEKKSLLHMPMIDLDPLALEYGEVSGLRLALEIINELGKSDLRAIEAELKKAEMKLQYTNQITTHYDGMEILASCRSAIHSAIEESAK